MFHHETHQHPGPGPFTGTTASFTTPTSGHDFTGNTSYEVVLDGDELSRSPSSTLVTIFPRKVNVTYTSSPPGLSIVVDSLAQTTPYTFDSLVGFQHTLDAPRLNRVGDVNYTFGSWSDGGARTHAVTVPSADQTLTATFARPQAPRGSSPPTASTRLGYDGQGRIGERQRRHDHERDLDDARARTAARSPSTARSVRHRAGRASLDLTTGMTLEAWVNPSARACLAHGDLQGATGRHAVRAVRQQRRPNRPLGQVFLGGAERDAVGRRRLPLNTWTHLAATYDGSAAAPVRQRRAHVDARRVRALAKTTSPLRIGGNSIWGEYFRGLIDDVRVYNRALYVGEIGSDLASPVRGL